MVYGLMWIRGCEFIPNINSRGRTAFTLGFIIASAAWSTTQHLPGLENPDTESQVARDTHSILQWVIPICKAETVTAVD